ncbi:MAG TPA: AAA family ATPase [Terriglobales bacterium]|nr:AAA family ATPase [Terriglobales bacterium]
MSTFLDRATPWLTEFGFSVIACDVADKGPYGKNARDKAISDATEAYREQIGNPKARLPLADIKALKKAHPLKGIYSKKNTLGGLQALAATVSTKANYGICSDAKYTVFETDDRERLEKALGFKMPRTFTGSARANRGYYAFEQTDRTRAFWENTQGGILEVPGLFEWRESGYVVGPGSIHPDTKAPYEVKCRVRPIPFPEQLLDAAVRLHAEAPSSKALGGVGAVEETEEAKLLEALHRRGNPEDMLTLPDDFVITSLHPLLKSLIAHLFDPDRTDEIATLVREVGEKYGHRAPGDNDVEDMVEWHIRHKSEVCVCDQCALAAGQFIWPIATRTYSEEEIEKQHGPIWCFRNEDDFALFTYRAGKTPGWAKVNGDCWLTGAAPIEYDEWVLTQSGEDPRLLTHAMLKATRLAVPSPEIVEGLISEKSANILVGDSGQGKTPLVAQLGVCAALGIPFLGQKTVQTKVMMVDYENAEALADVVSQICEHLDRPSDFVMDPEWFRIVQNVDSSDVLKLVQEFKPGLVIVDSLRGFCPSADTKNETASKLITELQSQKTAFLLMHHVRKNSTEKRDKRLPLEKEERVLDWLEAAAGSRALINQTFTRIAVDYSSADNADLVVRGFYKGRGEFGPWRLARNYSKQHGEPIGYDRLTGTDLLDIEHSAFFDALPKDQAMSYKEIQHNLRQSEGQITRFLAACENAGVVVTTGKRKTRSRRYTFLTQKKAPRTPEELAHEEAVQEAFK